MNLSNPVKTTDTTNKDRIGLYLEDNMVLANKIGVSSTMEGDMGIIIFKTVNQ